MPCRVVAARGAVLTRRFPPQLTSSIKENPRLRAAAEELRRGGVKVGDAVSEAIKSMEESEWMQSVSRSWLCTLRITQ